MRNGMQQQILFRNLPGMPLPKERLCVVFVQQGYPLLNFRVRRFPGLDGLIVKFNEDTFAVHLIRRVPFGIRFLDGYKAAALIRVEAALLRIDAGKPGEGDHLAHFGYQRNALQKRQAIRGDICSFPDKGPVVFAVVNAQRAAQGVVFLRTVRKLRYFLIIRFRLQQFPLQNGGHVFFFRTDFKGDIARAFINLRRR